jgi:hypothetical protein
MALFKKGNSEFSGVVGEGSAQNRLLNSLTVTFDLCLNASLKRFIRDLLIQNVAKMARANHIGRLAVKGFRNFG